jgi:L-threonylcarbamoyladenylate synthase
MEMETDPIVSSIRLRRAAQIVGDGGVIAYPTEAVFGLGCDPGNLEGVVRILDLKRRSESAGLILIAGDRRQLDPWIDPRPEEQRRLESDPGQAVTWIVTASRRTPDWITGNRPTVAVRITHHPVAAALCRYARTALISTSANLHGRPPARSRLAVRKQFGAGVDCIVPGPLGGDIRPTEIRLARTGEVLRSA